MLVDFFLVRVLVRKAELEVLDEWVYDEEVGEFGVDGVCGVPVAEVKRGEVGEEDAEELCVCVRRSGCAWGCGCGSGSRGTHGSGSR